VMMFIPEGLAGSFQKAAQLQRRAGWARLVPVVLACAAAAALLAAGTAFLVELLQRLFSQDYRALAGANAAAAWPPVTLFGRAWVPAAAVTWIVPAALLAAGGALVAGIRVALGRLPADAPSGATARPPADAPSVATVQPPVGDASRSAA
jgi:branched-chain amino acid transport system permease protein